MKYVFILFVFVFGASCFYVIKNPKQLPKTEKEIIANLINFNKRLKKAPNIFIFIENEKDVKTLAAKAFSPYKRHCYNESLFSLFHAENSRSFFYRKNRDWTIGSSPLRLLKNYGYQIHNISTKMLYEDNIEEVIFGKDRHLSNSYTLFSTTEDKNHKAVSVFKDHLKKNPTQNLFTLFLDPQKGSYQECISQLKKEKLYKDSVVIFLSRPRKLGKYLSYSLYLKLGDYIEARKVVRSCENILPTVLHYLFEERLTAGLYSGDSSLYSTSAG